MAASDWIVHIVLPLLLVAAGGWLLVRGRAGLAHASRLRGGFGGPPGSSDIGTEPGLGVDHDEVRRERLAARRQQLWGAILVGTGVVWLAVRLVTRAA